MTQASAHVKRIVGRYCRQLEQMGIRSEQVLLFGSQAKGTAHEGSDIDLLIVSSAWVPYGEHERLELLGIAAARILEPVQARRATPDEIARHQLSPFLEQVLTEQAVVVA